MQKVSLRIHPYDSVHSYPLWLLLLVRNRRLSDIATAMVGRGGDYILQVKDNQRLTKEEVQSFFCPLYDAHIVHQEQQDFDHGRIETRTMSSIVNPLSLDPDSTLDKWEGLKSIHMMTRVRTDKKTDKSSSETTFYISRLTDGEEVFKIGRAHV